MVLAELLKLSVVLIGIFLELGVVQVKLPLVPTVISADYNTGLWSTLAPMPTARRYHRCTTIGSKIFVIGGRDSNQKPLDSMEVYDYNTGLWSTLAPMSAHRYYHSCTASGSKIFVVGGQDSNTVLDSVEVYDYCTDLWSTMPPMSTARYDHSCTATESNIFVESKSVKWVKTRR